MNTKAKLNIKRSKHTKKTNKKIWHNDRSEHKDNTHILEQSWIWKTKRGTECAQKGVENKPRKNQISIKEKLKNQIEGPPRTPNGKLNVHKKKSRTHQGGIETYKRKLNVHKKKLGTHQGGIKTHTGTWMHTKDKLKSHPKKTKKT